MEPGEEVKLRKRRRWKRWAIPLAVVALAVILDGPGWQWLAGWGAGYYLPKLGLEGSAKFEGRLSGGEIRIAGMELKGEGAIQRVDLDELVLRYQPGRIWRGEVKSVWLRGLRAEIDLAKPWPELMRDAHPQSDFSRLGERLREYRQKVLPVDTDLGDVRLDIFSEGKPKVVLAPSSFRHEAGDNRFRLSLGGMVFPGGRSLPPQNAELVWNENDLSLEALNLAPDFTLRNLSIRTPVGQPLEFAGEAKLNQARFQTEGTLERATVRLVEGELLTNDVVGLFNIRLPTDGRLIWFESELTNLKGGLLTVDGHMRASLREIAWEDWRVSEADLEGELHGEIAKVWGDVLYLGERGHLTTEANLNRALKFKPRKTSATFSGTNAGPVISQMRSRWMKEIPAIQSPDAALELSANANFDDGRILDAQGVVKLTPVDPAVPVLHLETKWSWTGGFFNALSADGSRAEMTFGKQRYRGSASFQEFESNRANRWLEVFNLGVAPNMVLTGTWEGDGEYKAKRHRGNAAVAKFLTPVEGGPLTVSGAVSYDWPVAVEVKGVSLHQGTQRILANARLKDRVITVEDLQWTESDEVLLTGKATIPVTENPGDWRGLLRQTRPLAIDIESRELPLARLHPFLPETTRFSPDARGQLTLHVSGTPAEPQIQGKVLARGIGVESMRGVPKSDLDLNFRTAEGNLEIAGTLLAPGYPAAILTAKFPFRPGAWIENPELLEQEKIQAAAHLPNLELARFAGLFPGVKTLTGRVKGDLTIGGTLAKPQPLGEVELTDGTILFDDELYPAIRGVSLKARATHEAVELQSLTVDAAGGALTGSGKMTLVDGKAGNVDLVVRGNALPLKRNESMIVRANADLTVRGPWETATVSGNLAIVDSLYYRDIEILPIGVPFTQVRKPKLPSIDARIPAVTATANVPEPFRSWRLDVKAKTANRFLIRGNFARGYATLDLNIGGTLGSPAPRGQAVIKDVVARLPFSTLEIDHGTIDFHPDAPYAPTLNIRGTSRIRPYEVNLYLYGPVSDPQILTTSNPPLPDTEIMTLLATGTTTRGIEDPQAALTRTAQLLIEELRRGRIRNTRWLQPLLKILDHVDFQIGEENPYSGEKYNAATINIGDHWLISAGVSDEGNSRIMLMYLIRFR
jgi:autotransporter translocation and assembly factor TamB